MKKTVYIFDLDGTLVDAYGAIGASFNFVMKRLGYPQKNPRVIRRAVGWGDVELLRPFVEKKDVDRAIGLYRKHHAASLVRHVRLLPYAKDLLVCLKKNKIKLAIASNRPARFTKIILKALGIYSYFGAVLCADQLGYAKPHPLILKRVLKKFKARPKEAVYVGDMALDVETGRKAGIETIAVATGSSNVKELKKSCPTYLHKSLKELKSRCSRGFE